MLEKKTLVLLLGLLVASPVFAEPIRATLSPEVVPGASTLSVGDSLICNDKECYPKVFEAIEDWSEIREGQELPAGLDIRMNLETGLKEAKLPDLQEGKDAGATHNAVVAVPTPQTLDYEFTNDFKTVAELLDNLQTSQDVGTLESKLDDLMVFAHDIKHGYKIISHEFTLLRNISFNESLPISIREMGIRMVVSCLRNNPSSTAYVKEHHPEFIPEMFQRLDTIIEGSERTTMATALVKRFLSVLDELLSSSYKFDKSQMQTLRNVYAIDDDRQLKIKVLELVSKYFAQPEGVLSKRDLQETAHNVQDWAQELQRWIQDNEIDEMHTRKFFNSLYNIKSQMGAEVRVDPSFVEWLAHQAETRKLNVDEQRETRDLEQDSFDKKLIESRHLVFGNPMAHRIKHFNDEL